MIFDLSVPPGFLAPEIALLTAALVDGTREARAELGAVTAEELAFTAGPKGPSAAAVLLHHAFVERAWVLGDLLNEDWMMIRAPFPEFSDEWSPASGWPAVPGITLEELYRRSDEVRRETLSRLATIPDARQETVANDPPETARWVVNHLIGHEAYHFGQAVLLIELARSR